MGIFYVIILAHLYRIQIYQRSFYLHLAQQQYQTTITKHPARATIHDRNNQPLALNKDSFAAFIIPNKIATMEPLERFLKKRFPAALDRLYKNPDAHFLYVKRNLSEDELELIKKNNLADLHILQEPNRWYPHQSLGHIVGITDIDNKGLFGIELLYNKTLAGTPSTFVLEKDARSGYFYIQKQTKIEGTQGQPIQLTIDADLQFLVTDELKNTVNTFQAQEACAIIINPANGEILTMAQYPNFDPNQHDSIDQQLTKNRSVTEVYELGSVMKVFSALAALAEQVVTANEPIDCLNSKSAIIDGFTITTWRAHEIIPFSEVIQFSNNIGIATVAKRVGTKLYDHYKKLGFGQKTALKWPGQQAGFITPPAQWSRQSIISLSFGYEISANILQLAQAFCIIANNGYSINPTLVVHQKSALSTVPLYPLELITIVREILEKTVKEGTARKAALQGFTVMGKTGTANMVIDGKYSKEHNTYTFAGILEKDDYKRVIVTFVKDVPNNQHLYASSVAAPLFERIAENLVIHEKMV